MQDVELYHLNDFIQPETLQKVQDEFTRATEFAAVTVDYRGEPVTGYSNFSDFCMMMRNNEQCRQCCFQSDAHGGLEATRRNRPAIYRCHAGPVDFAIPIMIRGQYMGAFMAGQVRLPDDEMARLEFVVRHSKEMVSNREVKAAYEKLPVMSYEKVVAASSLMFTTVNNIVEKDMLKSENEELKGNNIKLVDEMKARVVLERALKDAEIKALYSQTNPHFLFNVLSTMGNLAISEKAEKTQELVYLLAEMLRYSVKNMNMRIPVEEELAQAERYLQIQKIRYGDRLSYEIDVSRDMRHHLMPSTVLMPFLENCFAHGFDSKEGPGEIKLLGFIARDDLVFEIVDNGAGMTPERLKRVLDFDSSEPLEGNSTGIGIANVYKRLAHTYGDRFKLTIKSKPGEGTFVRIKLDKSLRGGI